MPGIREIARAAGVSTATASRVLSNSQAVSADLRRRVRAAAAQLNYRPENARRGKRTRTEPLAPDPGPFASDRARPAGSGGTVLLVVPHSHASALHDRTVGYFAYVFSGMLRKAEEARLSLNLLPYPTGKLGEVLTTEFLQRSRSQGAKGILALFTTRDEDKLLLGLPDEIPWLALNRNLAQAALSVRCDDRAGARQAGELLVAHGHRRIGVICGPARYQFFDERLAGLREALAHAKLTLPAERIQRVELSVEAGRQAAEKLLQGKASARITALFTCEEDFAAGALQAAEALGLKVPDDLALVAFSDFVLSAQPGKSVTAVAVPAFEMGYLAIETLLNRARFAAPMRAEIVLRPTLVERQSVARGA